MITGDCPVLDGYIDVEDGTVKVWCPACCRWHTHGYDIAPGGGDPEPGTDIGHRAAHCPSGPYRENGGYRIPHRRPRRERAQHLAGGRRRDRLGCPGRRAAPESPGPRR